MVLTLRFASTPELVLGPSRGYSVHGAVLRQHPHDEVVAFRSYGMWHATDPAMQDEVAAYGFEFLATARVQFEDLQARVSASYGPFQHLEFRGDAVLADGQSFATFQAVREQWLHESSGVRWPIINIFADRTE